MIYEVSPCPVTGMNQFKEAVMKKFFVLFLAFVAGIWAMKSFADTSKKAAPVAKAVGTVLATPVNPATSESLLDDESGVPNDTLISWESQVEAKGLKPGNDDYEDARQLCIAYNQDFTEAHQLKADGNFLEAAKKVPLSWVRSWYLYNYAASLVADKGDDGLWSYNAEDVSKNATEAIKYFNMAKAYSDKAVKAGIVGKGSNSPENLDAVVAGGLKAISQLQNPPVKKAKKPVASKKKPVASDAVDE
jgi:hypothetical protein